MACVRETLDSLAQSSRSEEASPTMLFCLSYSSQQLVSISRTTSSRGEGQAEKTLCLVAVTTYVESTSGCYLTPLTSLPTALSISISCGQEKAGDYKYSFLSLLFCFVSILWDRVSYYLGSLKCCRAEAGLDSRASNLTVWVLGLQAWTNIPRHK